MIPDRTLFINTLNNMQIQGVKRRYWMRVLNDKPDKVASLFYEKLDRMYSQEKNWKIAKVLLLKAYPYLANEPEPKPIVELVPITYNLEYFLKVNGGRWGDTMEDVDEYERENGVFVL